MKECNYCKKNFKESKLNKTNLGLICGDCIDIITEKVNKSNKPIGYYKELLNNNIKF